ncbi:MAG TPA: hypothetical protein VGI03_01475 [Verrucomicrobiae bacterium]|jgi:hypothetical protein
MAKPSLGEEESALFRRVSAFPKFATLDQLTGEKLQEITEREGVDFATALLYDRVKRSPEHSTFITQIDQWHLNDVPPAMKNVTVGLVPAAYYKENPDSGADGKLFCEEAARLGLRCELIPVSSTGRLAENAKTILDWLSLHRGEKIILVSICKGGADLKFALGSPGSQAHFGDVFAWVNICGTLKGSPVAAWLLASKPRFFIAWVYFKCRGHSLTFLREIVPSPQGPLSATLKLPDSMRLINVVGFPLRRHLTNPFMRQCYLRISRQGPTDGGVLLADVCNLPGALYPVWGADHYLRPEVRARKIIDAILKSLTVENSQEELCPTTETLAIDRTAQTPLA